MSTAATSCHLLQVTPLQLPRLSAVARSTLPSSLGAVSLRVCVSDHCEVHDQTL